jgi:SAM-dependent methyltransferase
MKVWHSILNPVLMSDFIQLSNDSLYEKYHKELKARIDFSLIKLDKQQVYYQKRMDKIVEDMRRYHNWVKSNLIYTYLNPMYDENIRYKVLDIGCGVGGDVMKYYYVEVEMMVGIDPDLSGLISGTNCAVARYQNQKKTHADFPPMFFIQANPANLLQWDEQLKIVCRMSQDNKKLFDKFFTWDKTKTLFDRVNCSMSIHYLFSEENSWNNFCENLNMYMRDGALLTISTMDGHKVNDRLKGVDKFTQYYDENGEKKVLFEIVKKYDDNTKEKLGLAIDIHMAWAFDEGVYQTEYLVYPEFLIKSLKEKCNMELIETGLFEDLFNESRSFLELSSNVEEDVKSKKFFTEAYKYYTPSELNVKCYDYTFLHRYYVFRKVETNLNEIRQRKMHSKKTSKEKKQQQKGKVTRDV